MDLIGIVILVVLGVAGAFGYYLYRKKVKLSKDTLAQNFEDYTEKAAESVKAKVNKVRAK